MSLQNKYESILKINLTPDEKYFIIYLVSKGN